LRDPTRRDQRLNQNFRTLLTFVREALSCQQDYDNLDQKTDDWVQDLIDAAIDQALGDLQDALIDKAGQLQSMSADPDLASLPNIGTTMQQIGKLSLHVENLTTVADAVTSAVDARTSLKELTCGTYETGPDKACDSLVKLSENSSNAALIPGAQALAIPGAGLGLTVEALERIQAKISQILAAISSVSSTAREINNIVNDFVNIDPVGDARTFHADDLALPAAPKPHTHLQRQPAGQTAPPWCWTWTATGWNRPPQGRPWCRGIRMAAALRGSHPG